MYIIDIVILAVRYATTHHYQTTLSLLKGVLCTLDIYVLVVIVFSHDFALFIQSSPIPIFYIITLKQVLYDHIFNKNNNVMKNVPIET